MRWLYKFHIAGDENFFQCWAWKLWAFAGLQKWCCSQITCLSANIVLSQTEYMLLHWERGFFRRDIVYFLLCGLPDDLLFVCFFRLRLSDDAWSYTNCSSSVTGDTRTDTETDAGTGQHFNTICSEIEISEPNPTDTYVTKISIFANQPLVWATS